jgi:hypothetical protein
LGEKSFERLRGGAGLICEGCAKFLKRVDPVGIIYAAQITVKGKKAMMKTMEIISEAVRNPRHPFRKADNQPKKAQKNRYERRKIKEYLHLGDWLAEEMA